MTSDFVCHSSTTVKEILGITICWYVSAKVKLFQTELKFISKSEVLLKTLVLTHLYEYNGVILNWTFPYLQQFQDNKYLH